MKEKKTKTLSNPEKLPEFCDFFCEYAEFTEPEASGACRKELAVYCTHFKKYNRKHNKCLAKANS